MSRAIDYRSFRTRDMTPMLEDGVTCGMSSRSRSFWPPLPPLSAPMSSWPKNCSKTKRRQSHFGYPEWSAGDTLNVCELKSFHLNRQFSEDSGFSSCGSSASSVADDVDSGPASLSRRTGQWSALTSGWKNVPSYSGTVASVLAAAVSDSEETDQYESDEEGHHKVFKGCKTVAPRGKGTGNVKEVPSSTKVVSESEIKQFFQKMVVRQDNSKLKHYGRDILDLGSNLVTKFPLRASELPDKNLPLFLQNRSQYHRLGKFGTTETLCFDKCMKQCGFTFPVPPSER